jgi:predicted nucleic acid-binding protein
MARKRKPPKQRAGAFVLDGSVALAWCFADEANPYADAVARMLPRREAVVPAIWHLEIANALLVGERRGRSDRDDTVKWTAYLGSLPVAVDELAPMHAWRETLNLARLHGLSAYDASYIELALRRGLPLASIDEPLKDAAAKAGVELYTP